MYCQSCGKKLRCVGRKDSGWYHVYTCENDHIWGVASGDWGSPDIIRMLKEIPENLELPAHFST